MTEYQANMALDTRANKYLAVRIVGRRITIYGDIQLIWEYVYTGVTYSQTFSLI